MRSDGDGVGADGVGGELREAAIVGAAFGEQLHDPLSRIRYRQERTLDPRRVVDDSVEDLVGCGDEAEDPTVAAQARDVVRIEHHSTAGRDHQPFPIGQLGREISFDASEAVLAHRPEEVGDRAVAFLDHPIGVDELVPELLGEQPTDRGLAGAHEASEHDVAGIGGSHGITSSG